MSLVVSSRSSSSSSGSSSQLFRFQHPSLRVPKFYFQLNLGFNSRHRRHRKLLTVPNHNFGMKISGKLQHKSWDWKARPLVIYCFSKGEMQRTSSKLNTSCARWPDTAPRCSMESSLLQLARPIGSCCVL